MFSIIIPTYNRALVLEQSVKWTLGMRGIEGCEIIVVDDGSTDGTPDVLERLRKEAPVPFRVIRQSNGGPGVARNTGIGEARHEYVLFLDDDIFPCHELLHEHEVFLNRSDVSQGIVHWRPDLMEDRLIRFMDDRGMQFAFNRVTDDWDISYLYIYTANLALRKEHVLRCGGFDSALAEQRYAFEDTAFAYSLWKASLRLGLNRRAMAWHYHPMTESDLIRREYKVGFSFGVLEERYPEIAGTLGLERLGRTAGPQARLLRCLIQSKVFRFLGFEIMLRVRLREAFLRGMIERKNLREPERASK